MKTRSVVLCIVLALQTLWVLGTSLVHERALREGVVVRLETRPVDPRDLLRGDYVILSYQISVLPAQLYSPPLPANTRAGTTVYVALEKGEGEFHRAVAASVNRPPDQPGRVILKGRLRYPASAAFHQTTIDYGLERYYVAEGTGNPRGKLTADVAVPASGQARIKQVYVDGKPYADVMRSESSK